VTPVATVELGYRDLATGSDGRCGGKLAALVVADAAQASDLDSVVSGRLQRSETAAVLKDANNLFERGLLDEARRRLSTREQALRAVADQAKGAAPSARAGDEGRDFDRQIAAVDDASRGFAAPQFATPPPNAAGAAATAAPAAPAQDTRAGKSAVRRNAAEALPFAF
jgi:Ca-activated chloride channel family protein